MIRFGPLFFVITCATRACGPHDADTPVDGSCTLGTHALADHILLQKDRGARFPEQKVLVEERAEVGPDLNHALACLRKTTPGLQLKYPSDAEAHFEEIHKVMAAWIEVPGHKPHCSKYWCGPWTENLWIRHFRGAWENRSGSDGRLQDIFGPYIPLFVNWIDEWVEHGHRYPKGMIDAFLTVLRPDVPYITVSKNDEGLNGRNEFDTSKYPNILVLSEGGYGHVPLPLLKQPEPLRATKPPQARKYFMSYVGSEDHAPRNLRKNMVTIMRKEGEKLNATKQMFVGHLKKWREVMQKSRFSLTPRGFGRTSYHLMEALQMGLIPIHLYSDIPWVPYAQKFQEVGFTTTLSELPGLIERLSKMTDTQVRKMETAVQRSRESHFSYEGVIQQVAKFILTGEAASDLRCQPLPDSVRDA